MNTARLPKAGVGKSWWSSASLITLLRCAAVAGLVAAGCVMAGHYVWSYLGQFGSAVTGALTGGLLAAGATAIGTLPVAMSKTISPRATDVMLGFGAGVMLAASVFSLILPALNQIKRGGASAGEAGLFVAIGILAGVGLLCVMGRLLHKLPDDATVGDQGVAVTATPNANHNASANLPAFSAMHRAWLFAAVITLHNIPEGAAIGVAYAGMDHAGATGLATGIGLQDIPEGLAVALALRSAGARRAFAVGCGIASGLVEPLFAVLGALLVTTLTSLLPWALAAAAGAMLFVIVNDVIPQTQSNNTGASASVALMVGFVVMLLLDTSMF